VSVSGIYGVCKCLRIVWRRPMVGDGSSVVSHLTILSCAHFYQRFGLSVFYRNTTLSNFSFCTSIILTAFLLFSASFSSEATWRA